MELNRELYIKGIEDYLENGLNFFNGTWESGSINNSGANVSSDTSIRSSYVSIAPNTSYYFSSNTSSAASELWANYYNNGVFVSRGYLGVTNSKNFTTPAGVNQVRFRITFSDTVTVNVISNVMLNKGSIQLPYEPYNGGYASKDYLENGKNLFNKNNYEYLNAYINSTGPIKQDTNFVSIICSVKPNTTFTLTKPWGYSGTSYAWTNKIAFYQNKPTASSTPMSVLSLGSTEQTEYTFTTPANCNYILFGLSADIRTTHSDWQDYIQNIQLEKGSSATPYEEYYGKYITKNYLTNGKNKANIPTHTVAGQGTDYRIVNIEQNTTYTLSCLKTRISGVTITNGSLIMFVKFDFYNGSTKISSASLPSAVSFTTGARYLTYTFTTPANCDNILLNLGNNNGDNNKNTSVSNVMLNKGSTALPYEEYYGKYLNNADIINGILSNNQMWRFKSFSLSGATSYDLTFDSIDDLGQFSIVIINTITSSNSSTKIGFCRNFLTYSYSNIFQDHTGTDVITNVSRTAGNVLRITTSTTSSINVGVTYMRIFRQELNKN